jgi:hypothetical protein
MSKAGILTQSTRYQSYLLRLWRTDAGDPWRALLIWIPTGEQYHFTSVDACLDFVEERAAQPDSR